MSRQFCLFPWKLYHALTVRQPIFQKLFRTLILCLYLVGTISLHRNTLAIAMKFAVIVCNMRLALAIGLGFTKTLAF